MVPEIGPTMNYENKWCPLRSPAPTNKFGRSQSPHSAAQIIWQTWGFHEAGRSIRAAVFARYQCEYRPKCPKC